MKVSELMTHDPVSIDSSASVADVCELMRERDIRHVPIVERGTLVGIASDRDLARLDLGSVLASEGPDWLRQQLETPIVRFMSPDVISVFPEMDIGDAVDLLIDHKVGALPVLRLETGELVGILSYIDVLKALRTLLTA